MMDHMYIWAAYAAVNVLVCLIYGIDKLKAVKKKWRIPEKTLLVLALLGPLGALAGMLLFRHKIRKPKFYLGVPAILLLEGAAVYFFLLR